MAQERIYSKGDFIGAYEVVHPLSAGGTGIVYEAVPRPGMRDDLLLIGISRVAMKVARLDARELPRHARKVLAQRMDREFETMFGLTKREHPNVVGVYDRGYEEGVPYYVMEIVDGVTLGEALKARPRVGQAMHTFGKLCGAVAFLHHGGLCHRDLKPSNVMVRASNGEPVLIDFGICLPLAASTLTGPGELLGTPAYLSPEYAAHWMDPAQERPYVAMPTDDVWALGVIAYEVLTGGLPWRTPLDRRERLLREIQTVQPPHPSDVYGRSPRPLGDVVMRLLEKNPYLRPENASAVLALLGPAAEASDVLSPIPPRRAQGTGFPPKPQPRKRAPKKPRNVRGQLAGGTVAALLLLTVVFVSGAVTMSAHINAKMQRDTHGASQPGTCQAEAMPVAGDEGESPLLPPHRVPAISRGVPPPKRAYKGQKKPPCLSYETEMVGGCWREITVVKPDGAHDSECLQDWVEVKVKDGWKCYAYVLEQEPTSFNFDEAKGAK